MSALLTVGVPVFNGGQWLSESLDSILNQTFDGFEIVISDNQSVDDTRQIAEQFAARDDRVRYIRQSANIGIFRNYDAVFAASDSKYFKWASSNDICMPTMLEKCVQALESRPEAVLAYPTTVLFDTESGLDEIYEEDLQLDVDDPVDRYRNLFQRLRLNNVMNGVIRSSALRRTSLNKVVLGSDTNMIAELLLLGPAVHIDEPLFKRRMNPKSSASAKTNEGRTSFYKHEPVQTANFQASKLLLIAAVGAWRVPQSWQIKLRAFRFAAKRIIMKRRVIIAELRAAIAGN